MKKDIHPKYGDATVTCACGEVWHLKSTRPQITVGICAKCHPFFTEPKDRRGILLRRSFA